MPAIFISHSSLDAKIADEIKSTLANLGFERVFLDFDKETGIGAGENWEKRLYEELARCHAVILALTPNWIASKWCFAELQQARALGKVIFPIVCEPLGDRKVLTEIQAVDLLDWKAGGIERLRATPADHHATSWRAASRSIRSARPTPASRHSRRKTRRSISAATRRRAPSSNGSMRAARQGGARFVIIIGASGSGKSSLLKAGVLPQLARRKREWIVLPAIRPEKAPLEIARQGDWRRSAANRNAWRTWHERLQAAGRRDHVDELLKDLRVGEAKSATLLLPIDQFEEVFTIASAGERTAFLALLAAVLDPVRDLPVLMVATGRSDVLEGLLEGRRDRAASPRRSRCGKMPLDRVPRLIEGPAAVAGLLVETRACRSASPTMSKAPRRCRFSPTRCACCTSAAAATSG